jgi:hypothetical protein
LYGAEAKHVKEAKAQHVSESHQGAPGFSQGANRISVHQKQAVPEAEPQEHKHPSWEAKQRMRKMQAEMAKSGGAKKIVFGGDSDDETPVSTPKPVKQAAPVKAHLATPPIALEEGLHPSWEAKKKQQQLQQLAKSVKGSKKVFSDSE